MLTLHTAILDQSMILWAEDSEPTSTRSDDAENYHPNAAQGDRLTQATGLPHNQYNSGHYTVWLPSRGKKPIPSNPLAGPEPKSKAQPKTKPWIIDGIKLTTEQAISLTQQCHNQRILSSGVLIGQDLAYWGKALEFALSLTARQQYLPNVSEDESNTLATWTPLFIAEDKAMLSSIAKAMPPAARAITPVSATRTPDTPSQTALRAFINRVLDHTIRETKEPDQEDGEKTFPSVHDAWIHALSTPDKSVQARTEQLQQLRRQVNEWHRPIINAANSPYRLCLRLEEPEETDPDDHHALRTDQWNLRYMLQSHEDNSLIIPAEAIWKGQTDASKENFNPNEFLLASLARAGAVYPLIAKSLNKKHPSEQKIRTDDAYEFLTTHAATLQQAGFNVMLPAWWTRQGAKRKPSIRASVKTPAMQGGASISLAEMIDLDIDIALDGEPITLDELQELADLKVPLVRFRGKWVEINAREIRSAVDFWNNQKNLTLRDVIQIGLGANERAQQDNLSIVSGGWLDGLINQLQTKSSIESIKLPKSFKGELRPYQSLGYAWLAFLRKWGLGACLADDMGLGKTVQTLASLEMDRQEGNTHPNLLVCPTSLINNWQREAHKFVPELPVMTHHGADRDHGDQFIKKANTTQLVITSYGTATRDAEELAAINWRSVIVDEAQNIKNPASQQAQAVRRIPAQYRVALTGTPVENHVGDLWAIMHFLNPGLLGGQGQFKREYFMPIQQHHDQEAAERLKKATGPFILRRLKTDRSIIDDLPDKHETKQYCNLTREQATLYQAILQEAETAMDDYEGKARRASILNTLLKLKQACNHPRQLLGDNSPISGRSGKLNRLDEILDEILPIGDYTLIFSQYAEMGSIIQRHIQESYGLETLFLHGGLTRRQRDRMVERFQNEPDGPQVFVLSLKAGGSGLNLPRANHVVHYDRWWNPAVENQATDRAFRIGQTKDVHVHKMICAGTLEDRIDEMIEAKQETAQQVVGSTSERWLTELSSQELLNVLALRTRSEDE